MKFYVSKCYDPFFNLAFEEYMMKNLEESLFLIYQNDKCVIIGKNQNPHTEAGIEFLNQNEINIVRRMSGGGAVYQDLGNFNYSFILKGHTEHLYDFKKYSEPIINLLNKFTTSPVYFSGRNDLLIDDKKFSGTAQMTHNDVLVHHGTILYNTDFSDISKILIPNNEKLKTKGVKSVRSRVANLKDYLPKEITYEKLKKEFVKEFGTSGEFIPSFEMISKVEKLAQQKRDSIQFILKNDKKYNNMSVEYIPGFGTIQVYLNVKDKKIIDFDIFGEYFFKKSIEKIKRDIIGIEFNQEKITEFIYSINNFSDYFHKLKKQKLIQLILGENYNAE